MKLIIEKIEHAKFLKEEKDGIKSYFIEGIFMQSELQNRNGRIYPKEILDKEVKRYVEENVKQNRAYGELCHPEGPTINLDKVSHLITSLTEDGNNFVGRAKILDTPNGRIVKTLIDEGCSIGVSTRGVGSIIENGSSSVVQDDFFLATAADIVADPSAPEAFVRGILEGKEWVWQDGLIREINHSKIKKEIHRLPAKAVKAYSIKAFQNFVNHKLK